MKKIENHARCDFQIRGVARRLCEMFSKRHAEIDERTRELLAREPEKATGNVDDIRAKIARDERSRKNLEHVRGENLDLAEVHAATAGAGYIHDADNPRQVTTRDVLQRKWNIVEMAKDGIKSHDALSPDYTPGNPSLDQDQRQAVARILSSHDL